MSLDSVFFLSCFLPVLAAAYFLPRGQRARNAVLLIAGGVFCAFNGLASLLLLLALAAVNYALGQALRRAHGTGRGCAALAVALDLLFLVAFKYLRFLLSPFAAVVTIPQALPVPVGVSFVTFKCISYIVDAYRDRSALARRFVPFLQYVFFFPQLTAGPIARYSDFARQLETRSVSARAAAGGLRRCVVGLGKKLLLAGALSRIADPLFAGGAALDARSGWVAALAFLLQIYFDFAGYSDMAIGLGELLGFETPENFDRPYTALSVTEFWRRWHISLSSWFRDYLYIPLGGNRKGRARCALNKLIVFALCGFWHGAAWTFLLWGLWHGLFSALESLGLIPVKRLRTGPAGRVLARVYTLAVVCLGFVMFRADSLADGWRVLAAMFGAKPVTAASTVALLRALSPADAALALLAALLVVAEGFDLPRRAQAFFAQRLRFVPAVCSVLLLLLCIMELSAGSFAPFIYAQF